MRIQAVWTALALVGCTDGLSEEPTYGEETSTVVIDNRLSANRLSANRLSANRLSANRLSANRLSANNLQLTMIDQNDLVCSSDGQEVLAFIVSCAIEEGETLTATGVRDFCGITDPSDPTPDTFEAFGELGLANKWLHKPLDDKGAGWVSACLFARVNASSVPIPVSLRGPNPHLKANADEREGWPLEEGAFFGNYFGATLEGHPDLPDWHACRGRDQALQGEIAGLIERDCTEPDPANPGFTLCGFAYAGECGDFGSNDEYACKSFSEHGTYYRRCAAEETFGDDHGHGHGNGHGKHDCNKHGHGHGHGHGNSPDTYREVITAYVLGG